MKLSSEIPGSEAQRLVEVFDGIVASKTFSRSEQLKRLLIYLRDVPEGSDPSAWSETAIGTQALGRKDFNPKLDTIVRVEMRRLRQKLDEYYATEGAESPVRLRFERNTYRPFLEPYILALAEPDPEPVSPAVAPRAQLSADRLWTGVAWGVGASALVAVLALSLWFAVGAWSDRASRELADSPVWAGFSSGNVVVAIGTPLFFRSSEGFERNFSENLPQDLSAADQLLAHRPAFPVWNLWATFDDVGAAVNLDRFLKSLKSTITVAVARQMSIGGLAGKRTIIIGQPRFAPLVVDLLADQNFRARPHTPGAHFSGFVNAAPKPGEAAEYSDGVGPLVMQSDESSPDYALVTRIRMPNGGEVLNVFGDRAQTGAYVIRKLTDPAFVADLNTRVFGQESRLFRARRRPKTPKPQNPNTSN